MRKKQVISEAKSRIEDDVERYKSVLKKKLNRLVTEQDNRFYSRRLERIFELIQEKGFVGEQPSKVLGAADLFQKIEMFMDYDRRSYTEDEMYEIINQVFRSLFVTFLLSYLDEEPSFRIPGIGSIAVHDSVRYSELFGKHIQTLRGRFTVDAEFRRELRKIKKEEKISIVQDILASTSNILKERVM